MGFTEQTTVLRSEDDGSLLFPSSSLLFLLLDKESHAFPRPSQSARIAASTASPPLCFGGLIGRCLNNVRGGEIIACSRSTGFRRRRTELNKPPLIEISILARRLNDREAGGGQKSGSSQTKAFEESDVTAARNTNPR